LWFKIEKAFMSVIGRSKLNDELDNPKQTWFRKPEETELHPFRYLKGIRYVGACHSIACTLKSKKDPSSSTPSSHLFTCPFHSHFWCYTLITHFCLSQQHLSFPSPKTRSHFHCLCPHLSLLPLNFIIPTHQSLLIQPHFSSFFFFFNPPRFPRTTSYLQSNTTIISTT